MIISIDGVIGAGKSSVLRYLETGPGLRTIPEPVRDWQPYLDELYAGVPGSAFRMQTKVWLDRCLEPPPAGIVYVERSPRFQWECFALNVENPLERRILAQMYEHTRQRWEPHVYVYLRCSPETCFERIRGRSGGGEDIPLEYLRNLHARHEQTARSMQEERKNVVIISTDDGRSLPEIAQEILDRVFDAQASVRYEGSPVPVPERLVYDASQVLDWAADWNCDDDDYNPPASLCRSLAEQLRAAWKREGTSCVRDA